MSEFTAGILLRLKDSENAMPIIETEPCIVDEEELNDEWLQLVIAGGILGNSEGTVLLERLSVHVPALYFFNAGDLVWGYRLFHRGIETARLLCELEADYQIAEAALKSRYPNQSLHDEEVVPTKEWQAALATARQSVRFQAILNENIACANPTAFAVLDLRTEQLAALEHLLDREALMSALQRGEGVRLVDNFRSLLNIEAMGSLF